ncbi:FKBP-type peptidyl-prolyl cis-trans isomerase [Bifidobacterium bombi]|uniref:peptidylprolyl isomerase n=1 Tax=Bifidobacterium bombi DSM 19703 TaxID=1341695 RepID=A0A080N4L3_9BIFI|nr:FKBP-type peptidyl-prolyl cis-trans isomerase [Bifidobacterium bombi]KFF31500.1 peptidyl-prolyl cis-trans isomerase, FKBP-type [Bifidobacterium bombi DSM 19703]
MHVSYKAHHLPGRISAAVFALALALTVGACGAKNGSDASKKSSSSQSQSDATDGIGTQMAGVSASGEPGKKPKVTFHVPMQVVNNSYAVLQKGNGAKIEPGQRLCVQDVALNAKDGSELMSSWEKNTPDCSLVMNKQKINATYYNVLINQKVNSTVAFGVNDKNSAGTSYIMAVTVISASANRANGEKVKDIPSNLPKVKLGATGKPSIDLNGYQPDGKLVVQTLIKGKGKKVEENDTIDAHYSGWVKGKDGKPSQFDSSWDRGESSVFSLQQVVAGWTHGLAGQTVGSQVLLIIPPDQGYGNKEQKGIPANSTLYFVVDILDDQGQTQS